MAAVQCSECEAIGESSATIYCASCFERIESQLEVADWQIRKLITYVQAFINHHRHPECFSLPDLEQAKAVWEAANKFNRRREKIS